MERGDEGEVPENFRFSCRDDRQDARCRREEIARFLVVGRNRNAERFYDGASGQYTTRLVVSRRRRTFNRAAKRRVSGSQKGGVFASTASRSFKSAKRSGRSRVQTVDGRLDAENVGSKSDHQPIFLRLSMQSLADSQGLTLNCSCSTTNHSVPPFSRQASRTEAQSTLSSESATAQP